MLVPPTDEHETISARLTRILDPFVAAHRLGFVYHPRAVMRFEDSEVEPDLMVRSPQASKKAKWENAPTPILIVEILSGSTRRRDYNQKRSFYMDAGVEHYWIIDPDRSTITSLRLGQEDHVASEKLVWSPAAASESLAIRLADVFG